ncbi:hypothetical protein C922_01220 [Plasmodium inui San Antonio 1]|uniref:Uncharacterized protein n=1 Tax=Plasmodium inui San Antonio 1 TaxID=1237626 RepID=W7A527_9APIC|nr:hypothetical protein C922_01220 [Plasmodium inui San Antonio 1]EUD68202.1 hypothetical protein C922_01220 [Plasmodium inui San Antonio 1]
MIKKLDKEKPTFECIEMNDIKRLNQEGEEDDSDEDKISLDDLSVCSPSKLHKEPDLTEDEEEEQEKLIHSKLYESMNNVSSNIEKKDTHWFDGVDDSDDGDDADSDQKGDSAQFVDKFRNLLLLGGDKDGPEAIRDDHGSHNGGGTPRNSNYSDNPPSNLRCDPISSVHGDLLCTSNHREKQPPPEKYLNCSGESEERSEKTSRHGYHTGGRNPPPVCSEMGKGNPSEITEAGQTHIHRHVRKDEWKKWRKCVSSDEESEKGKAGRTPVISATNEPLAGVANREDIKETLSHQNNHSDESGSYIGVHISAMPITSSKDEATHRIDPQSNQHSHYAKGAKRTSRPREGSRAGKTSRQYSHRVEERGPFFALPLLHSRKVNSDDEDSPPFSELAPDGWATSSVCTSDRQRGKDTHRGGVTNNVTRIISRIEESVQEKKTKKGGRHHRGGHIEGSDVEESGSEGRDSEGNGREESRSKEIANDDCDKCNSAWVAEQDEQADTVTPVGNDRSNPALPTIQMTFVDTHKVKKSSTPKYSLRKYGSQSYSQQVGSPPRGGAHNDMGLPLSKKSLSSGHVYVQDANEEEDRSMQRYGADSGKNQRGNAPEGKPIGPNQRESPPEPKHGERNPHSDQTQRHAYRVGAKSLKAAGNVEHGGISDDLRSRPKANLTAQVDDTLTERYKRGSPTDRSRLSPSRLSPSSLRKELEEQRPFMDDTHFDVNPIKINDRNLEKCFHAIKDLCNMPDGKRTNSPSDRRNVSLSSEHLDRSFGAKDSEGGRRWSEVPDRRGPSTWRRHIDTEDTPVQNVCKSSDVNLYENNFKCLSKTSPDGKLPPDGQPRADVYRFFYKENELWDGKRERSGHPTEGSDHRRERSGHRRERSGHPVERDDEGKVDRFSTRAAAGVGTGDTASAPSAAPPPAAAKMKRRIIDCKNERLKWGTTQVIIDIDDTIRSSGGYKFFNYALGGVDAQYQRGETYPGSFQFIFELAMNKLSSEAKPLLLSVLTARIPQVPITEDSFLNKKFNEVAERRGIKNWGIDCDNKILYSTLKEWVWNETRGEKKFVNFKHLHKYVLQQNSLVRYIWIGDTGDMDKQAGEMMIRTYPQRMKAVFLHHVKGKDDNTLLPSDYFIKSVPIFFFRTYIGAATKAHAYNLIDKKGLTRVLVQAVLDLEKSKAPASSSKWEDLIKDIILSDAMDELDKYNAETVNRTKKIIAQRMLEISERKLHFIS